MSADPDASLTVMRVFDAPGDRVLDAFVRADLLVRWWAPHAHTSTVLDHDPAVAGSTRLRFTSGTLGVLDETLSVRAISPGLTLTVAASPSPADSSEHDDWRSRFDVEYTAVVGRRAGRSILTLTVSLPSPTDKEAAAFSKCALDITHDIARRLLDLEHVLSGGADEKQSYIGRLERSIAKSSSDYSSA